MYTVWQITSRMWLILLVTSHQLALGSIAVHAQASNPSAHLPLNVGTTSSPAVAAAVASAAAAAALGLDLNQPTSSGPALPSDHQKTVASLHSVVSTLRSNPKTTTTSSPALVVTSKIVSSVNPQTQQQQFQQHATQTPTPTTIIHRVHKHPNGILKINVTDKLHKFDLFIDPICEQLVKLTEKQLNKVSSQLKQFSAHVSCLIIEKNRTFRTSLLIH